MVQINLASNSVSIGIFEVDQYVSISSLNLSNHVVLQPIGTQVIWKSSDD